MEQIVFWAIWAALAVFMGYFYLHHAHGIRSFLRGTGTGLVALLLLHELGGWIGFAPAKPHTKTAFLYVLTAV